MEEFVMKGTGSSSTRNLKKDQLGGVIFGCNHSTIKECLSKQLFGLPASHFSYVSNIDPGLPLFLFNYSDRKLNGIFEAASCGQMNINPYGWTTDGSEKTQHPAQVQIRVRHQCQPLREDQFKQIIADNYHVHNHFWFELDHAQTSNLMSLFASFAVAPNKFVAENTKKWRFKSLAPSLGLGEEGSMLLQLEVEHHTNQPTEKSDFAYAALPVNAISEPQDQLNLKIAEQVEKDLTLKKLQELAINQKPQNLSLRGGGEDFTAISDMHMEKKDFADEQVEWGKKILATSSDWQLAIAQELRAFKREQSQKMDYLEQKLFEAEKQIQHLNDRCMMLESMSNCSRAFMNESMTESCDDLHPNPDEAIYLLGGFDGESFSSAFDAYFPSQDLIKSLSPMNSVRSYASTAQLHGEIYIFGGGNGQSWYDTVEAYNLSDSKWTFRPSLFEKKGSLAGVTLDDKIFALGGGNGKECFSHVEMLDLDVGRWIPTRSMLQKRFALAARELNGAIYATGGYDGSDYLRSVERFDPREHSWTRIASMNTKRGCHSLVVFNEKLCALGGYDGNRIVQSTEIYDPRLGSWINGDSMNRPRGYSAAAVVKGSIYVIGGVKPGENTVDNVLDNIVDTVEHFKEGQGWQEYNTKSIRRRSFMSAIAL